MDTEDQEQDVELEAVSQYTRLSEASTFTEVSPVAALASEDKAESRWRVEAMDSRPVSALNYDLMVAAGKKCIDLMFEVPTDATVLHSFDRDTVIKARPAILGFYKNLCDELKVKAQSEFLEHLKRIGAKKHLLSFEDWLLLSDDSPAVSMEESSALSLKPDVAEIVKRCEQTFNDALKQRTAQMEKRIADLRKRMKVRCDF